MFTALELPGVYARPDLGRVWCLDHVEASFAADGALVVENPTDYPARVRILRETAAQAACPLDELWFLQFPVHDIAPRERKSMRA